MSIHRAQLTRQKAADTAMKRDTVGAIAIPSYHDSSFLGKGGCMYGPALALRGTVLDIDLLLSIEIDHSLNYFSVYYSSVKHSNLEFDFLAIR